MKKIIKNAALTLIISAIITSMVSCGGNSTDSKDNSSSKNDNSVVIDSSSVSEDVSVNPITAEEFKTKILEKVAFEQFTKRFDDKFDTMSKTLDKVVENQEHIKDFIIQQKGI
jgi:hypothetical protein